MTKIETVERLAEQGEYIQAYTLLKEFVSLNSEQEYWRLNMKARLLAEQGDFITAAHLAKENITYIKNNEDAKHEQVLKARLLLAWALGRLGELEAAREEASNVYQIAEAEQVISIDALNGLARFSYRLGDEDTAIENGKLVVNQYNKVLGPKDIKTLIAYDNLSNYLINSNLQESRRLIEAALSVWREIDLRHPKALTALSTKALIDFKEGHLSIAVEEAREVLLLSNRILGASHPNSLKAALNLSNILYENDYNAAHEVVINALAFGDLQESIEAQQLSESLKRF